jgi:uncharacterized protein (TIGR03437 family)
MLTCRWLILTCAVLGGAGVWGRSDDGAAASVASLNAQILGAAQGRAPEALLRNRFALLRELIESNPDRALELALPDDTLASLRDAHPSLDAQLERRGQWEGTAYVLVEDSADLRFSRRSLRMHTSEGNLRIYLGPAVATLPGTHSYRVEGVRAGDDVAATSVVALDSTASGSCSTTGDQKTIALLVNVPDSLAPTYTADQVQDWMFGSGLSLNGYWQDASYGQTSASGRVAGWIALNQVYTGSQYGELTDAVLQQAAAQGIDLTRYSRIFVFLPQLQEQGFEAGLSSIGCADWTQAGTTFSASVEWVFPEPGANDATILSVVIHEGGHGLGLDHSTALECGIVSPGFLGEQCTTVEYGDPYSVMGEGLLGHYTAPQKYALGWLQTGGVATVPASGTVHLEPLSSQVSGTKAARTPRTVGGTDWLWMEVREPVGPYETAALDQRALAGGVAIHFQPQNPPGPIADLIRTQIVDVWPGSLANAGGAAVAPGSSWTDVFSGLTVGVAQAADAGLDVSFSRANTCAVSGTPSTAIGGNGGTGTIAVTAAADCAWSASSAYDWLTIEGTASGAGSGTVTYRAAANPGGGREGLLTIGGLGVLVAQAAQNAPPVIVGASPQNSTGRSVALRLNLSDNAPSGVATVSFSITAGAAGTPVCTVTWNAQSNAIQLMNDDGLTFSSAGNGTPMDLENGNCAIRDGNGWIVDATELSLTVLAAWKGAPGVYTIYLRATDTLGNDTGWQSVGSWTPTADRAPAQPVLADGPGAGFQHAFAIQATDPDGASDIHTVELDIGSGSQRCSTIYTADPYGSALEFLNDDGSWSDSAPGNPTVAQNRYCSLDLMRTGATANGNTLTAILPVTFTNALAGTQPVQAIVTDWSGASSQLTSSWTVAASGAVPVISAAGIANGASWTGGAVSTGEIVTIFGSGLGPKTLQTAAYAGSELRRTVAGTTVFFNSAAQPGVPAPLIYVSESAVSAVVPVLWGNSVSIEVASHGGISNLVTIPTANETPGIFTYPNSLQAVAVNQDGSYNIDKPAERGSYITFFVTGAGVCRYNTLEFMDVGAIPPASPWAVPGSPVTVQFGDGTPNQAGFAGLTWPGVVQVNAIVDLTAPTGDAVPLRVIIADPGASSASSATTVRIQ